MSEKRRTGDRFPGVPFDSENADERRLWDELDELPRAEPSPRLRHDFYRQLAKSRSTPASVRLREWLGFRNNAGWLTAAASLLLGVALSQGLSRPVPVDDRAIASLQQQVAMLNRSLILDRMESPAASKRLRGIVDAVGVAGSDPVIASALLSRATGDPVSAVRSAAIDALGTQLAAPGIGDELMRLLVDAPSPLVQLALVDLVLRHGTTSQLESLVQISDEGRLHPDVQRHVESSIQRSRA